MFRLTEGEFSEKLGLAEVAKRVPQGVFCLLTALQFCQKQPWSNTNTWPRGSECNLVPGGRRTRFRDWSGRNAARVRSEFL